MRAMRGENGGDALDVGLVVEHHPAAAIHLHVDEAGGEKRAFGQALERSVGAQVGLGRARVAEDARDPPVADKHDGVLAHALAIEEARGEDGEMRNGSAGRALILWRHRRGLRGCWPACASRG